MIKTKTVTGYTIESHPNPDLVIEKVRQDWLDLYMSHDENIDSLKAFCDHFDVIVADYSIGLCGRSYVNVNADQWNTDGDEMQGARLWKYLNNNGFFQVNQKNTGLASIERVSLFDHCGLTGYFMDDVLLDAIKDFMKNPEPDTTMRDLMNQATDNFIKVYTDDMEHAYSDSGIREMLESNEYYFDETGDLM